MYERLLQRIYSLENNAVYAAVRKGFILIIPAVITGSVALLIRNFPILALQEWMESFAGGLLADLLVFIFDSTVGFMSALLVLAISYYYAENFAPETSSQRILAMLTSLACFVASFGGASGSLSLSSFGPVGVFTAMVCAIAATKLFFTLDEKIFHRFSTTYTRGGDVNYRSSMNAIWPMMICVLVFVCANLFLNRLFHVANFNDLISNSLVTLFEHIHSELATGVMFTLLLNLLWIFGIHGGNALDPVAQTVFVPAGTDAPMMITKSFIDNFAMIGGSGTTICLLLALLFTARSRENRKLSQSAAPLILFNINEILVFGLPVVLNPILVIPFILVPMVSLLIAYGATITGLMPIVNQSVTWTTPVFFSGYLATGSFSGVLVQLIIVLAGTLIYIPFVRFSAKLQEKRALYMLDDLTRVFQQDEKRNLSASYLGRNDTIGVIAKALVSKLREDIRLNRIPLYYQPQMDANGHVAGGEGLLRWQYAGKPVYPPLAIALAKEDGCFDDLTWCVIHQACRDIQTLRQNEGIKAPISVNIAADQLDHSTFIYQLIDVVKHYQLEHDLMLEVTEERFLGGFEHIRDHIKLLRNNGIEMTIDDFGMGQTSIDYLRENNFHYVKLDGSLVRQVGNPRCAEIIASIVELGKNLDFQVVAEYVENEQIFRETRALGCCYFQGYFYSPAIPLEAFVGYCQRVAADIEPQ